MKNTSAILNLEDYGNDAGVERVVGEDDEHVVAQSIRSGGRLTNLFHLSVSRIFCIPLYYEKVLWVWLHIFQLVEREVGNHVDIGRKSFKVKEIKTN